MEVRSNKVLDVLLEDADHQVSASLARERLPELSVPFHVSKHREHRLKEFPATSRRLLGRLALFCRSSWKRGTNASPSRTSSMAPTWADPPFYAHYRDKEALLSAQVVSEGRHKPEVHAIPGKPGSSPRDHRATHYSREHSRNYSRRAQHPERSARDGAAQASCMRGRKLGRSKETDHFPQEELGGGLHGFVLLPTQSRNAIVRHRHAQGVDGGRVPGRAVATDHQEGGRVQVFESGRIEGVVARTDHLSGDGVR